MPKEEIKPLEERIKGFASRIKKDFGEEIQKDPSRFKSRVIGTLRALLPRQRPGRKANPEIVRAAQVYQDTHCAREEREGWNLASGGV